MTTDGATTPPSPSDELAELRREVELLRDERRQFLEQQRQSTRTIEQLQHQLQQLLRRIYGRSSEKIDPSQMLLFEDLLEQLALRTDAAEDDDADKDADDEAASEAGSEAGSASSPRGKGHGRRRLPKTLPREKVIHDLPEDQKTCPCCGEMRHVIGREVSEQLDYVPAKLTVIEHVRLTYACRHCEAEVAESGSQVVTAPKPASPIEKGLAAPGLLAYVVVSKYGDHLPLYRLEHILQRHGIEIARSTMCGWAANCAELLRPLYDRMVHEILQSKVIHTDDTPVKVLDPKLKQTRTGRFWVYLGDPSHPFTVFDYTPNRCRDGPMEFLLDWGKECQVYLQADAFGGYDGIYAGQAGGMVIEVACWAHARRKFYEANQSDAEGSTRALAYIRLLYDVETLARKQLAQQDPEAARSPAQIRLPLRQETAVPHLGAFKTWLESQQIEHGGAVLPKSPMGQAIGYTLNQWDALCVYATDGDLAIDNNLAENALRRIALGRKNWLFCGSDNGGHTGAVLFSFLATCQRHKVEPLAYLRDVLTRIPTTPADQLDRLLPNCWQPLDDDASPIP